MFWDFWFALHGHDVLYCFALEIFFLCHPLKVVSVVRDCSQGEDPKEVKEKEESGCILL